MKRSLASGVSQHARRAISVVGKHLFDDRGRRLSARIIGAGGLIITVLGTANALMGL